jgi:hypothetical protein
MRKNSTLNHTLTIGVVVGIVCLSSLSAACFTGGSQTVRAEEESAAGADTSSPGAAATAGVTAPPEDAPVPSSTRCPASLRVGVLLDKSGSVHENVVPQLTDGDLDNLISLVDTCAGGEVAVGVLCNVSGDKPFARLYLSAHSLAAPATAPAPSRDPFTDLKLARAAATVAAQRRLAEEREAEVRRVEIERFRTEALALVQAPISCTRTDVVSGANRLLTYLAEPLPVAGNLNPPKRVAVFVTDAKDNVRRQTLRHDPDLDAAYLLVGGSPDAGALTPLNPSRFESMGAALRWMQSAATAR